MKEKIEITKISGKGFKFEILEGKQKIARARLYLLTNDLHQRPFGFIEDVFVREGERGKGYGTKIINVLIEKAKKEKCYKLIGTSRLTRKRVHKFFNKLGFKKYGYEFRMNFK